MFRLILICCFVVSVYCKTRAELLASPDRAGYGAGTTGGSERVVVNSFAEMKTALTAGGKYVVLGPSFINTTTMWTSSIYVKGDTTLDGSEAPNARFTLRHGTNQNDAVVALVLHEGNVIVHGLWLDNVDINDMLNGIILDFFIYLLI